MGAEEQKFKDDENRFEEVNRFRKGCITQHLKWVDIEEKVIVGGVVIELFEFAVT